MGNATATTLDNSLLDALKFLLARIETDSTQLVTARQAAKILELSRQQVYYLVKTGALDCLRIGDFIFLSIEEVQWYKRKRDKQRAKRLTNIKAYLATKGIYATDESIAEFDRARQYKRYEQLAEPNQPIDPPDDGSDKNS